MSFTTDAFQAARADLARYQPAADTPPAMTYRPRTRTERPVLQRGTTDVIPAGPLLLAAQALRAGYTSSLSLVEAALTAIDQRDGDLHAVVTLLADSARQRARALDAELAAGAWRGPLHGIPISVKDVIHVAGVPTYAGSDAYYMLPRTDAEAVARLQAAGAIVTAKVATHEFALGVTTPQARHPADFNRIPGGSSGGSAISVATGMALASLGTDTRASIRVPAALCGVVGFKPTFGLVPTAGIVPLAWTMDHIGPLAASVADAACLVDAIATPSLGLLAQAGGPITGMRVGVPVAAFEGAEPAVELAVRSALRLLETHDIVLVDVPCPSSDDFRLANAAGLAVSRCEAAAYHNSLQTDRQRLWAETADQLAVADRVSASEYLAAQRYRYDLAQRLLDQVTALNLAALAMPTSLVTAPLVSQAEKYLTVLSRNSIPWSFIGWPALSVPCPTPDGVLPVGLQLVAPPFGEATVVRLGCALERLSGQHSVLIEPSAILPSP